MLRKAKDITKHTIRHTEPSAVAIKKLDELRNDAILFIVDDAQKLLGSITDGDIRRGLLKGLTLESNILLFT